jgi:hypothetical protein
MTVRKCLWDEIKGRVVDLNPTLAGKLERVSRAFSERGLPSPHLFLATYKYGDLIVSRGRLVTATDESCDAHQVVSELGDGIPLAFILRGSAEVFLDPDDSDVERSAKAQKPSSSGAPQPVPLRLLHEAEVFGVFEAVDLLLSEAASTEVSWSVAAGARSLHLLMQTGNAKWISIARSKLGLSTTLAKSLTQEDKDIDIWPIIRQIAQRNSKWTAEVLMIPSEWYQFASSGIIEEFLDLQNFIYELAWKQSTFLRSAAILDTKLRNLCDESLPSSKKWHSEFVVHLKAIVQIAVSDAVGYEISNSSDCQHGPFKICTDVLREINNESGVKPKYDPIILQPCYLKDTSKVFYSTNIFRVLGTPAGMDGKSFFDEMDFIIPEQEKHLLPLIASLGGPDVRVDILQRKSDFLTEIDPNVARDHDMTNVCPSAPFYTGCVVVRKAL